MRKMILVAAIFLMAGCGTKPIEVVPVAELPMKYCTPPAELLIKAKNLPPIKIVNGKKRISIKDLVRVWASDITAYNKLNTKDSALIDYIKANCIEIEQ